MSRILLIDDERDVRAMISIVLRVNHFDVVEAASAAAGLKAFAESLFDVAIVDIFLGESNGFDVIAAMRERAPRLPVVASCSMISVPVMSAGIRSGVNWTRPYERWSAWAKARTIVVLPTPGTPSSRAWPPAMRHTRTPRIAPR